MKTAVVVPTIREECLKVWFDRWAEELKNVHVIVVEDNPEPSFKIESSKIKFDHYSWKDIDNELSYKSWIIPKRTDCVRSFGLFKAWQQNYDMIVTLDDDCYPDDENFIETHKKSLFEQTYPKDWFQHSQSISVRGVPKNIEFSHSVANMGLWSNIPDFDAVTQISNPNVRLQKKNFSFISPFGYFSPISGMNLAFRRETIPSAYFLLMGKEYGVDRFGDIWMGVFLKRICDHLGVYITGGDPYIRHERASNPTRNYEKEKLGYDDNNMLWKSVRNIKIVGSNFRECYLSLADQLPKFSDYWEKLKIAMKIWANLFE
ncbi:MAG: hypothetical protein ABIB61_01560 [Candidatus Shapirobacteria bacterium]